MLSLTMTFPTVCTTAFSFRRMSLNEPLICPGPVKTIIEFPGLNAPLRTVEKLPPTVIFGEALASMLSAPKILMLPLTMSCDNPEPMVSFAPAAIDKPPRLISCITVRRTGLFAVSGMTTLSPLIGVPAGFQFPGLVHNESNAPVQDRIGRGEMAEQMIVPPVPVAKTTPPVEVFTT